MHYESPEWPRYTNIQVSGMDTFGFFGEKRN